MILYKTVLGLRRKKSEEELSFNQHLFFCLFMKMTLDTRITSRYSIQLAYKKNVFNHSGNYGSHAGDATQDTRVCVCVCVGGRLYKPTLGRHPSGHSIAQKPLNQTFIGDSLCKTTHTYGDLAVRNISRYFDIKVVYLITFWNGIRPYATRAHILLRCLL